jgi:twitching motility protein PilT
LDTFLKDSISTEKYEEFHLEKDLDFSASLSACRCRVNASINLKEIALTLRLIPNKVPNHEDLNLPDILLELSKKNQGLILVTGPTGSGKSTTLASLIEYINSRYDKKIITLEDPIEFVYTPKRSIIKQREVGTDTKTFASGLRAALRQDPDVILVGEMRDAETIDIAIKAAETGHLVFATLHTVDAPQTIDRIVDVFDAGGQKQVRTQLASILLGVVSQRLVPTADGKGRVAAMEIMIGCPAISNLIRTEKVNQIKSTIQTSKQMGMQTMENSLKELLNSKTISEKEFNLLVTTSE